MNLRWKLTSAFGASLILAVGAGLFGVGRLDAVAQDFSNVIDREVAQERLASKMLVEFKTQVQEWKDVLLRGKDPAQLDKYWTAFQKHESQVQSFAQQLQSLLPAGEARALTGQFAAAHMTMGANYRKGFEAFKAAGFDSAVGDAAVKGMDRAPAGLVVQAGDKIATTAAAAAAAADAQRRHATVVSLALMLAVVCAGLAGAVLIARSVIGEIGGEPEDARAAARRIAQGDLSGTLAIRAGDSSSVFAAMGPVRNFVCEALRATNKTMSSPIGWKAFDDA
ncbi:MAG: hypothetical protein ABW032_05005 [Burkholderiaceae bacterium]